MELYSDNFSNNWNAIPNVLGLFRVEIRIFHENMEHNSENFSKIWSGVPNFSNFVALKM